MVPRGENGIEIKVSRDEGFYIDMVNMDVVGLSRKH